VSAERPQNRGSPLAIDVPGGAPATVGRRHELQSTPSLASPGSTLEGRSGSVTSRSRILWPPPIPSSTATLGAALRPRRFVSRSGEAARLALAPKVGSSPPSAPRPPGCSSELGRTREESHPGGRPERRAANSPVEVPGPGTRPLIPIGPLRLALRRASAGGPPRAAPRSFQGVAAIAGSPGCRAVRRLAVWCDLVRSCRRYKEAAWGARPSPGPR
jgi:hypothetical protein